VSKNIWPLCGRHHQHRITPVPRDGSGTVWRGL